MPWVKLGKDEPERYRVPVVEGAVTPTDEMIETLLQWRKEERVEREECLKLQKEAADKKDYELAKEWSAMAAEHLKNYRAICLVLGHYDWESFPGDCRASSAQCSKELAERCDTYFIRITFL